MNIEQYSTNTDGNKFTNLNANISENSNKLCLRTMFAILAQSRVARVLLP